MSSVAPDRLRCRPEYVVLASVALTSSVLVAALGTPGYSHTRDTVSLLGAPGQPMAMLVRGGIVAYGVLLVVAATPLCRAGARRERAVGLLACMYGASAVVAGLVAKDPSAASTVESCVHVDACLVGGAAVLVAMLLVATSPPACADRARARITAAVTIAGTVAFRFAWGSPVYGLVERALLAVTTCWLLLLARGRKAAPR